LQEPWKVSEFAEQLSEKQEKDDRLEKGKEEENWIAKEFLQGPDKEVRCI